MSYSLSQLDAIGDVDPVAEADVYLAYGRDLQAEEILKEAMRSNPDRLAIRTKLLEVYAKRRDTKGFELLATQLYALTRGEGEDWAKAQELGQQIDPENPLYQPGGAARGDGAAERRPHGRAAGRQHDAAVGAAVAVAATDAGAPTSTPARRRPRRRPRPRPGSRRSTPAPIAAGRDAAAAAACRRRSTTPLELRLPTTSLPRPDAGAAELDADGLRPVGASRSTSTRRADSSHERRRRRLAQPRPDIGATTVDDGDPLARKLELAEEFRQIGDTEGARDLLEEVIAKAERRAEDARRRACSTNLA